MQIPPHLRIHPWIAHPWVARPWTARLWVATLLAVALPLAADVRIYQQSMPDGTMVFSDVPELDAETGGRLSYGLSARSGAARLACASLPIKALLHNESELAQSINRAAGTHGLDPLLILTVAQVESCLDPAAVSPAGAQGLMQLMPATARELGVQDVFDASDNLQAGTRYLATLLQRFDYNLTLALAAYNAGPGAVERFQGVPPFAETTDYLARVTRLYQANSHAWQAIALASSAGRGATAP